MEEPRYHYRARGEIGNPDTSMREDVQLSVATDTGGEAAALLELRSEQFPAGQVILTPEQVEHLVRVLETARPDDAGDQPTDGVVHPDGCVDADGWDTLR